MNIALPVNQYLFKLLKCMIADTLKNDPFTTISTEQRIKIHEFLADKAKTISEEYIKKVFNEGIKARSNFTEHTLDALVFFLSNQKETLYRYDNWADFIKKEGNNDVTKKLNRGTKNFAQLPLTLQKEINDAVWQRLRPEEEKPFALPNPVIQNPSGYTIALTQITKAFSYYSTVTLSFIGAFFVSITDTFGKNSSWIKVKSVFWGTKTAVLVTSAVAVIGTSTIAYQFDANAQKNRKTERIRLLNDELNDLELSRNSISNQIDTSLNNLWLLRVESVDYYGRPGLIFRYLYPINKIQHHEFLSKCKDKIEQKEKELKQLDYLVERKKELIDYLRNKCDEYTEFSINRERIEVEKEQFKVLENKIERAIRTLADFKSEADYYLLEKE